MNMEWFDWAIVVVLMSVVTGMALYAQRYTRTVADFIAANRCAGRYLLVIAGDEVSVSAMGMVAWFEVFYNAGFTGMWWQFMKYPTTIIIALSGYVIYRFRQTRAMTVGQFFEMRYSRKFRIFMGLLAFTAGIINFGIFPAVGGRFFMYFCGFPESFAIGSVVFNTFPVIMIMLLGIALFYTLTGGQITVMVTDFFQGLFTNITVLVVTITIFVLFSWDQISQALLMAPEEASLIHPIHTSKVEGFNAWYFVMWTALSFYATKSWQGSTGYDCAALTPHEAKMGRILGQWSRIGRWLMFILLVIGAYTIMHHPDFSHIADRCNVLISQIENPTIQNQQRVPIIMGQYLPQGVMGAMCMVILAAFVSTHNTYMHSWGSVFIQDVVMPFRKKPFDTAQHLRLLRLAIAGVVVFIFFFSWLYKQNDYVLMFLELTGAIFTAGSGVALVGGLYWKKGTTTGAWAGSIVGTILAFGGLIVRQIYVDFPLNGMHIAVIAAAVAATVYITVSLLSRKPVNLDKVLHHGKYATADTQRVTGSPTSRLLKKLGMTDEFTRWERVIYVATLGWHVGWFLFFFVVTIYCLVFDVGNQWWLDFWHIYIWFIFPVGFVVLVWLFIGGIRDIFRMFKYLKVTESNKADDGWVTPEHVSTGEKVADASSQEAAGK